MGGPGSGPKPGQKNRLGTGTHTKEVSRKSKIRRGIIPSIGKVIKQRIWYDKRSRSWVSQKLDRKGNQVGDAEFSYKKPDKTAPIFKKKWKLK